MRHFTIGWLFRHRARRRSVLEKQGLTSQARKPNGAAVSVWGPPLLGLAGTVAGMLVAFARIGTEPPWKTSLVGLGFSLSVVGAGLIILAFVAWSRRQ